VLVLVVQASLTPYLEEGGLVLASVGEDRMDTPTLVFLTRRGLGGVGGVVVVDAAGVGSHLIGTLGDRTIKLNLVKEVKNAQWIWQRFW